MRVKDFGRGSPVVLGDFGLQPKILPQVSKEEILALQAPSTRQALLRPEDQDVEWRNRPLPEEESWKREIIFRELTDEEIHTYLEQRRDRDHAPYYKADLTTLIDKNNIDGTYVPYARPKYKLEIAKKVAEPSHPRLSEFKEKEEQWHQVSWFRALIHWLKGDKVKRVERG